MTSLIPDEMYGVASTSAAGAAIPTTTTTSALGRRRRRQDQLDQLRQSRKRRRRLILDGSSAEDDNDGSYDHDETASIASIASIGTHISIAPSIATVSDAAEVPMSSGGRDSHGGETAGQVPEVPSGEPQQVERRRRRKAFDIQSKTFFLTYPRADGLTTEHILRCIVDNMEANPAVPGEKRFPHSPHMWLVGKENHQPKEDDVNIGIHYHCYFEYKVPIRIRDSHYFDIKIDIEEQSEEGVATIVHKDFHPNIQSARNRRHVAAYCAKDGDTMMSDGFDLHKPKKPSYTVLLKECTSIEQLRPQIVEHYGRDFATQWHLIKKNAGELYAKKEEPYWSPFPEESWRPKARMIEWLETEFTKEGVVFFLPKWQIGALVLLVMVYYDFQIKLPQDRRPCC
jgi:hypothetical protein